MNDQIAVKGRHIDACRVISKRSSPRVLLAVAVTWHAAMPACSDDSKGSSGRPIALEDYPAAYAAVACAVNRECWGEVDQKYFWPEPCEDWYTTQYTDALSLFRKAIAEGRAFYRPDKAPGCIEALRARRCNAWPEPAACVEMLDGTRAVGGECASDLDCAGNDTYCASDASCPGVCARQKAEGESCSTSAECSSVLYCSTATERCTAPAESSEPCGSDADLRCNLGLWCIGATVGSSGRCVSTKEAFSARADEPCIYDGNAYCEGDLRCVFDTPSYCAKAVPAASECTLAFPDMCPKDQYCLPESPDSYEGICTPVPGAGEPCAATSDNQRLCASGLYCDGVSCRARVSLGGSCSGDSGCRSGWCIDGTCALSGTCQ
ncbi:MAG TPA: hypothetical protein VI072_35710 [Polyangiaceae bacterium]